MQEFLADTDQTTFALEAPTGVGKTFALLVPVLRQALSEGKHVLFLTASIALQEQLINKDLPRLRELMGLDFEFGLLKGRSNYVCLRRAAEMKEMVSLFNDGTEFEKFSLWLRETKTGDLAELDISQDDSSDIIPQVAALSRSCIGTACPYRNRCFIQKAYRAAQNFNIIVANYHLFFSHVLEGRKVFPVKYDWLICDEAHRLSESVRSSSVRQVSLSDAQFLLSPRTIQGFERGLKSQSVKIENTLEHAEKCITYIKKLFELTQVRLPDNGEFCTPVPELVRYGELATQEIEAITGPLSLIETTMSEAPSQSPTQYHYDLDDGDEIDLDVPVSNNDQNATENAELMNWVTNLDKLQKNLDWCLSASEFPRWAYWAEGKPDTKRTTDSRCLTSKPVASDDIVQGAFQSEDPEKIIFASATLAVSSGSNSASSKSSKPDFAFWSQETGVIPDRSMIVDSPFDFKKQMEVLVCDVGLKVGAPGYDEKICKIMEQLCDENGGRTLVLLSSMRLMRAFAAKMREKRRGYTVLVQRDMPHRQLLQRFLQDETSILIGSVSFREGVDIPGSSLTQVIIDRIPFPHPNDPMVRARDELEGGGGAAFKTVTLPLVRMSLRQEVGRLIRSTSDHGRVVLLDGRAVTYKTWNILSAFPNCPCKQLRAIF